MSLASNRGSGRNDNERRADAALRAIAAGTDCEFRTDGVSGLETDIEDLLANIRHLCDRFGLAYGDRDDAAYRAYLGDFEDGRPVAESEDPSTELATHLEYVTIVERQTGDGDGVYVFRENAADLAGRYAEHQDGADVRREVLVDRMTARRLVGEATADDVAGS